jgi:hypothetical protein
VAEPAAIERAERECTEDADARAEARVRAAAARIEDDKKLVRQMAGALAKLFPRIPEAEAKAIAKHTAERGSGRVGRSAAGRELNPQALTLAVAAAVRHNHTRYDQLLRNGVERADARQMVGSEVQEILERWKD